MIRARLRSWLVLSVVAAVAVGAVLGRASGQQRSETPRNAASPALVGEALANFELVGTATVDIGGSGTEKRRRVFEYSTIVDGKRYRIDVRSSGAEIGLLPRLSVAFDGSQTWLLLPRSEIVTIRTGDIEGPLPVPVPDPVLLQFQAILATRDPVAARELSAADLAREPELRENLLERAADLGAQSRLGGGSLVPSTLAPKHLGDVGISWARENGRWVPSSFSAAAQSGRGEWKVLEFFEAKRADGVPGIPKRVLLRAVDGDQEPLSEMTVLYEVRSFKRTAGRPVEDFRLDDEVGRRKVWDEDARVFLRN
jgi:hypothetical protein